MQTQIIIAGSGLIAPTVAIGATAFTDTAAQTFPRMDSLMRIFMVFSLSLCNKLHHYKAK